MIAAEDRFIEGAKASMAMYKLTIDMEKIPKVITREYLIDWYLKNENAKALEGMPTKTLIKLAEKCCGKTIQH